jgi:hypothetical protein
MPTLLAIVVATTASFLIGKAMAETDYVRWKAALQLIVWGVSYYFTKRMIKNLSPD